MFFVAEQTSLKSTMTVLGGSVAKSIKITLECLLTIAISAYRAF